jgi:hypothetical protein
MGAQSAVAATVLSPKFRGLRLNAFGTFAVALAALPLLLVPCAVPPAAALELRLEPPRESGGYVWVDARLSDLLSTRVRESLARGMPATLHLHAELWRPRGGWFHRLESSVEVAIKIRFEVWSESYRIERRGLPASVFPSLDSVLTELSRPVGLPVSRISILEPGTRYYIVTSATLKPLSIEDIVEGEGWLSGEVESKRRSGLGIITALPRSVFDALRNFAGLGDERVRAITPRFELEWILSRVTPRDVREES